MSQMKHQIKVGDTLTPIGVTLKQSERPVDLEGKTVKFEMEDLDGTSVVAESDTGVTAHPTFTFTLNADNDWLVCNDHRAVDGDQVVLSTTGNFDSTGVAASTRYFVVNPTPNNFQLSLTPGGAVIGITGAGTGTHSFYIVGSCQKDFAAGDVDTAGTYRAWFSVHSGSEFDHFPNDNEGITVEVK